MSDETSTHQGQGEIIIVKKVQGGGGGHHGGAWKIAYADFVTAMMAFFLVMWLVNAANEDTKASVASYFNPIKLLDNQPSEKGVKRAGETKEGKETSRAGETHKGKKTFIDSKTEGDMDATGDGRLSNQQEQPVSDQKSENIDADYFKNPYAVLAEIVMDAAVESNISKKGDGGATKSGAATGASGGDAYRDPFDPDFWNKQVTQIPEIKNPENPTSSAGEKQNLMDTDSQLALNMGAGDVFDKPAGSGNDIDQSASLENRDTSDDKMPTLPDAAYAEQLRKQASLAEAKQLENEIIAAFDGKLGKLSEGLEISPAEGGLLLSLTDQANIDMFNVGSAIPKRDLVLMMEKIAEVLKERKGALALRGHTDARPFSSGGNDNWRLSMTRAHSAYFMLVRGGIPEERITQVSGFADRRLKIPEDPYSQFNRRIEILIESQNEP